MSWRGTVSDGRGNLEGARVGPFLPAPLQAEVGRRTKSDLSFSVPTVRKPGVRGQSPTPGCLPPSIRTTLATRRAWCSGHSHVIPDEQIERRAPLIVVRFSERQYWPLVMKPCVLPLEMLL